MFQDYIQLNFSLILNAYDRRTDSSSLLSTVLLTVTCGMTSHAGYPAHTTTQCAGWSQVGMTIAPTGQSIAQVMAITIIFLPVCQDLLLLSNPSCQVQASAERDGSPDSAAENSINSTLFWQSPVRTGTQWHPWLQFDFLTVTKVTKIYVAFEKDTRGPTMVRCLFLFSEYNHIMCRSDWTSPPQSLHSKQVIDSFQLHHIYNYLLLGETVLINSDSSLDLTKHVTARFIRLVIVETNDVTPSIKPITLNKLIITISVQHF